MQQWRETFAEYMRDQGVDAEATPRRSRGVVRKAERNTVRHIEHGDDTHKPRVPYVKAAKVKQAADELAAEARGLPVPARPWEEAIKARQREVRRAWLAAADALEREHASRAHQGQERSDGYETTAEENKAQGNRIRAFVAAMPSIDTELYRIKRNLAQRFTKQPTPEANAVRIDNSDQAEPKQATKER